eukprot:CAMPEP_0183470020 /NCGR_PEP_ID=MMETSP0370-20130417/155483_1 /TAXON_ID=268820 /ORGANISM="Peridinium aciculiferum, Strain PAER-2" /LENGTH=35 /DNA_ID= /DNA_START= /DNA_END= /DNA_ORIENTATION=
MSGNKKLKARFAQNSRLAHGTRVKLIIVVGAAGVP